jgi:hypothetical protein
LSMTQQTRSPSPQYWVSVQRYVRQLLRVAPLEPMAK